MTDREMLELAAKAIGLHGVDGVYPIASDSSGDWHEWNPLTDDGDEARLEAALGLNVEWGDSSVVVSRFGLGACEPYRDDKQAARRLAGVKAAAAIGKSMEGKNA